VVHAPAIRIIPLADDTELERVTRQIIDSPPDIVVATTGIGFRGWMEAAEGWGEAEELGRALAASRLLARGPKAKGAIRAADLREEWSPASESSAEVLDHLLGEGVEGKRIAVQLHGATTEWEPIADFCEVLRCAGADVIAVPVYRWTPLEDQAPDGPDDRSHRQRRTRRGELHQCTGSGVAPDASQGNRTDRDGVALAPPSRARRVCGTRDGRAVA
jgi:uroporphyrinogen-III synthase